MIMINSVALTDDWADVVLCWKQFNKVEGLLINVKWHTSVVESQKKTLLFKSSKFTCLKVKGGFKGTHQCYKYFN